ncbi:MULTISPECIES: hypothetical protein [Acinetobacter]|jgi:hypothetical protein|uniref:Uncharacterized protein n=1 Tax=Acinetobacter radioresistens TaxID=40216 RepID=A0A8H2PVM5_ACIRA|nr:MULTISPECIES: hypothetical protein [Acinetobacter]EXB34643.1 hypothetical protein J546_0813 [Acinetobacter sp. 1461402]EXB73195.1 hypothetical protein J550_1123 [Acinetobacter sp. 230853]PSD37807.1 hypothetical protein C7E16_02630 [Acinetobacter radioresistens]PSD39674.1 hypothetical protein C7E21_03215 [Acinetobacter radioresistens]TNX92171.1 hypothetical protein FHY67_08395 [Acinetobacter radioresistens]
MNITCYAPNQIETALTKNWDICLLGKTFDARDDLAHQILSKSSTLKYEVAYDSTEFEFIIINKDTTEEKKFYTHDLDQFFSEFFSKKVIIDATTFDVAVLACLCKYLKTYVSNTLDIFYIEPEDYDVIRTFSEDDFNPNLSDSTLGFEEAAIPELTKPIESDEHNFFVFLMGYEGHRVSNAFEKLDYNLQKYQFIFGVPSFVYSWEHIPFSTQAHILLEKNENSHDYIKYCGANNLIGTYRLLQELKDKNRVENLFLIPLGTKIMGLAAIQFLCHNPDTYILYDYPNKVEGRSSGAQKIHLIESFL